MYAVIAASGRQYFVREGETFLVDLQQTERGATIEFDRVLMIGGTDEKAKIGQPVLEGAKVVAEVVDPDQGQEKIHVRTYKRRKNYRRHKGHRQRMTEVRVQSITG